MGDLWTAYWLSFGVVFIAELGEKSQLIALTFATRYRPALVMTGIAVAAVVINAASVAVGYGLGLALPTDGSPWSPAWCSSASPYGRCEVRPMTRTS